MKTGQDAREKLNEYAKIRGLNTSQLLGWSVAADFAEWYIEQQSHPTSLPSDWTKQCSCNPDDKTGETWCCNNCGKPTSKDPTSLPSDEESRYDVTFGGHVKALISVQNGHITVIGAVSGYGDSIIEETTVYKQLTP